ncbi:MAG: alginate lyase family protein [Rhizobiaceae bacterium]|nr:alginate lyase family protein [Rhizobiaceae bacterium]
MAAVPLVVAQPAATAGLVGPFAAELPSGAVSSKKLARCAAAPAPVVSLATTSRYVEDDPTKSAVDPARSAAYDAAVKPLRDFQSEVVGWANDGVRHPKKTQKGGCALVWVAAWAKAGALSALSTNQSEFNRDQALSSLALAYLQLADLAVEDAALKPAVVSWFRAMAADVVHHYDNEAGTMSRANNHRYFAALGVGAAAIAAQDEALFGWAMATLETAACAADPSGALPLEMQRGSRARHYQLFAAGPLVMLAEMAARNGRDPYALCDGGLTRIVEFGLRSLDDPSAVEALAGEAQIALPPLEKRGSLLAWLAPYASRFPESPAAGLLEKIGRPSSTALGGNLAVLFPAGPGVR